MRIFILLLLSFFVAIPSYADCINPAGIEGDQVYNSTHKTMQFCDGTNWYSMKGGNISGDNLGNHTATTDLNMDSNKITNITDPTAAQDAATKAYVDASGGGASGGMKIFDTSGTFTVPAGVTKIEVTVIGGGAGGDKCVPGRNGGWVRSLLDVSQGQVFTCTVGAGGQGTNQTWHPTRPLGDGKSSSFGGLLATGAIARYNGGSPNYQDGVGSGGIWQGGGDDALPTRFRGTTGGRGQTGQIYGGGGGMGGVNSGGYCTSSGQGGNGASGACIIEW